MPKRHSAFNADSASHSENWTKTYLSLRQKLGSGFTVAFIGPARTGKTQMATSLALHNINKLGQPALYATATTIFMDFKAAYNKNSDQTEKDIVKLYRQPNLLIIDEFGRTGESQWERNLFFEILNYRYQDLSDTIVIANMTRPSFTQAINASLASRMGEGGGIIAFDWPNALVPVRSPSNGHSDETFNQPNNPTNPYERRFPDANVPD